MPVPNPVFYRKQIRKPEIITHYVAGQKVAGCLLLTCMVKFKCTFTVFNLSFHYLTYSGKYIKPQACSFSS